MSYEEVADLLSQLLGRSVAYHEESFVEAEGRMLAAGAPAWSVESAGALWAYQRAGGPTAKVSPEVERILGRRPRSMMEFLRDHREAFSTTDARASAGSS